MMNFKPYFLTAVSSCLVMSANVRAQDTGSPQDRETIETFYAAQHSVSALEATQRLGRLKEISSIEKQLSEKFPNQFGGLYVVHSPEFRVIVKMTGNGQGLLKQITSDPLYTVEKAETPVKQLYQLKDRIAKKLMADTKGFFTTNVNIREGVVEIRSLNIATIQALMTADLINNKNIRLIQVSSGGEDTATIYGGARLAGSTQVCTTGFNVSADGGDGIITSGHCDPQMTVSDVTFRFVSRAYKDSTTWGFDVQFMRPSSDQTYPNQFYKTSSTLETVSSVFYAADLPLNWPLCAYGRTTNALKCGTLKGKFEVRRDNRGITGSFFRAATDDGSAFNTGGDSGGPVFGSGTAYGIIKGKGDSSNPNDMYFMDIQTLEAAGGLEFNPRVKTTP